jgi:hypothetical protein
MMTETTAPGLDVLHAVGARGDGQCLAGRRAGRAGPDGRADGQQPAQGVAAGHLLQVAVGERALCR